MNYRHSYHAGNFADVIKHITLIALIEALQKKNTPFCYLDTHAGTGIYDLQSTVVQKSKEYINGIEKIIDKTDAPELIKTYVSIVREINARFLGNESASSTIRYYPGSPLVARELLREEDRLIACELHPDDSHYLKTTFLNDKQVATHHIDGYLGLKAFLPPAEKRGVILIDPPYEQRDEFKTIVQHLLPALKRFNSGIYAIWYPIKDKHALASFYRSLKAQVDNPILTVELSIYPNMPNHLVGSGLAIINPPWQLDATLKEAMPWLWKTLSINHQGGFNVTFLK